LIQDAWDNWASSEFERCIRKNLGIWEICWEDEDMKKVFELGRDRSSQYWEEYSDGISISVEKVAAQITLQDLDAIEGIEYELDED
jgi:hypothetical protein